VEESTELFNIGVTNTTSGTPGILIRIKNINCSTFKTYKATKETPKTVCDLTVDLATARPGEIIKSTKFNQSSASPYPRSQANFFQDYIVLLDHVYI
jgi:hypothetical protein